MTIPDILKKLEQLDFPPANAMIWVGKGYSKQDLINDLTQVLKETNHATA